MRRYLSLILTVLVLSLIAYGAFVWLTALGDSLEGYTSPLQGQPPPGEPTTPAVPQVVLIIVDGLRYDTSLHMPFLDELRQQGASARMLVRPTSLSQPTWTTLASGAWPEINGAGLLNREKDAIQPMAVDNLFAAATRAGLEAGLAGSDCWQKMIPPDDLYAASFPPDGEAHDRQVVDVALRFLRNFGLNLLVIHLDDVDDAGHEHGGASAQYLQAALRADGYLREIAGAMDLERSVLIVVSDHGHTDRGGHCGRDEAAATAPFVMAGPVVRPGRYGP